HARRHERAQMEKELEDLTRVALDTVRKTKGGDLVDVALVVAPLRIDGAGVGYVLSFRDVCVHA
ncbi:MAG: hypothetical protein P4L26_06305, partial [Terracidiphilus sp.]|nr:hypothetical protein [Terracidiphilus sp.]